MRSDEAGFTIVEVLISAIVVVLVAMATFAAITTAGRTTAETRHRAQAYAVAQQDQARLRTFKVSALSNYSGTRTQEVDGTPYSVASRGEFVTDATGTQTCAGNASADYISISSTVTWPSMGSRPPVVIKSIVSPPNGSIAADRGALAVSVVDGANAPIAGVTITGSGPSAFSDTTDENGCVLFGNLPAGTYTITPTTAAGLVDNDGNAPAAKTTSVVAQSTNTLTLQYAPPGRINTTFRVDTNPSSTLVNWQPSSADTVMAYNTGMTGPKRFGTLNVKPPAGSTFSVEPLFPFTSPVSVYAGACDQNNPTAPGATPSMPSATGSAIVTSNGTATVGPLQLPALFLTVRTGSSSSNPGSIVVGGNVVITDPNCSNAKRTFTTNGSGALSDPGLPWGTYTVCADNGVRRRTHTNIVVKNATTGTPLTIYLNSFGSSSGVCS
jgi:Tfp pilus assembly protein PilV